MDVAIKNKMLEAMVESLKISGDVMKSAENRYLSVGDWFDRDESTLKIILLSFILKVLLGSELQ
ncbi:hypothetical protein [Sulfurimonas sp.]|uniref:hypothetical protein n=1 Tax=Sulfurimonas sp. TaxID=2022749 RepID=UPI0019EC870B|nr:hypothetical protein [Sulfurimonas sp.]MBE0513910.1 hypothetical protein [Sulfurimonas sp.]